MCTDRSLVLAERTSTEGADAVLGLEVNETSGPAAGAGAPARSAVLVVERGLGAGSRFLLDRDTTVVGRSGSDIVLDAVTVSGRHAEFRRHGATFVVVDVDSFNGTYVNRHLVATAALADGDEVQIGKFRLTFHPEPGEAGPGASVDADVGSAPAARAPSVTGEDI